MKHGAKPQVGEGARKPPAATKPRAPQTGGRRPEVRERSSVLTAANFRSLLWVVIAFLVIRTLLMEAFRIPSGSMEPTLLIGDFLFVNKLAYGPHIPFTGMSLPGYSEPQRDDIAVYRSPDARDGHPTVVKRVVALAGDTIHMRDGQFYVNGEARRRSFGAPENPMHGASSDPDFDWQRRVALAETRFGPPPDQPTYDDWGPLLVPDGHFFSLGDHRHNSKDARHYGFVPRGNVRGRPLFIYYSFEPHDTDSPVPFITDIRWRRIGSRIR